MGKTNERRLKDIKDVADKWTGGFTSANSAMSDINRIMSRKYIDVSNLSVVDRDTGKTVDAGSAVIIMAKG